MPPVGFEPTISAGERPQTYALDRAATGTGTHVLVGGKKYDFAFTSIRQELPWSEKFLCYFWLSNTYRKCTASADINSCCLLSVCPSRATCIMSTIKTIERKPRGTVLPCITVAKVCQRRRNHTVTGSLCISAGHCNQTGLGTHLQLRPKTRD